MPYDLPIPVRRKLARGWVATILWRARLTLPYSLVKIGPVFIQPFIFDSPFTDRSSSRLRGLAVCWGA